MKTINRKIEMLCYFLEDGTMKPQRFRIETREQEKVVYIIKQIQKVDFSKLAGIRLATFICQIVHNGELRLCEIRYNLETCEWVLFKM